MEEKRRRVVVLLVIPFLLFLMFCSLFLFRAVGIPAIGRRKAELALAHLKKVAESSETPVEPAAPETTPAPPAPPTRVAVAEPPKTLSPIPKVEGEVFFHDGRPAPFAEVDFFVFDQANQPLRHHAKADEKGAFALDCPRFTHAVYTAHAAGAGRMLVSETIVTQTPGSKRDYGIELRPEAVASGVVVNADGTPAAGATLKFHPFRVDSGNAQEFNMGIFIDPAEGEPWWKEWVFTDSEATTDPTGGFRAPSLWSGIHYVAEVLRTGRDPEFVPVAEKVGSERLRMRLSR